MPLGLGLDSVRLPGLEASGAFVELEDRALQQLALLLAELLPLVGALLLQQLGAPVVDVAPAISADADLGL